MGLGDLSTDVEPEAHPGEPLTSRVGRPPEWLEDVFMLARRHSDACVADRQDRPFQLLG